MTNYRITQTEVCLGCGGGAMGIDIDGCIHCSYTHLILRPLPNGDVETGFSGDTIECNKKEWHFKGEK